MENKIIEEKDELEKFISEIEKRNIVGEEYYKIKIFSTIFGSIGVFLGSSILFYIKWITDRATFARLLLHIYFLAFLIVWFCLLALIRKKMKENLLDNLIKKSFHILNETNIKIKNKYYFKLFLKRFFVVSVFNVEVDMNVLNKYKVNYKEQLNVWNIYTSLFDFSEDINFYKGEE